MPEIITVGDALYWSYANLGMAHAAVSDNAATYGRVHYMVRGHLFKCFKTGDMTVRTLADDERLKLILPQSCAYCAGKTSLSVDHLLPTAKGGANIGDNMVWACRSCNSSKGATDLLVWLGKKEQFPPLLLLRRYLKLAVEHCKQNDLLDVSTKDAGELPFALSALPHTFPAPADLRLWITDLA